MIAATSAVDAAGGDGAGGGMLSRVFVMVCRCELSLDDESEADST